MIFSIICGTQPIIDMKKLSFAGLVLLIFACSTPAEKPSLLTVDTDKIKEHIKVLSSDEFMGRKPFSEGEYKTITYLENAFKSFGLEPGNNGSFYQDVPMVELNAIPEEKMTIEGDAGKVELTVGEEFVAFSERVEEEISLESSEIVFAGFGIVAPEYDWNDYEGLDVKGKTVIVLVNDPGFGSEDSTLFKGKTMTYYGRWTYKYEEAARQGAAGVFIVHETVPAGYPWSVVKNSWSGSSLYLDNSGENYKPAIQGWITRDAAIKLFELSKTDMRNFVSKSRSREFQPKLLGLNASLNLQNGIKKDMSRNVVAKITGSNKPEETIIYSAHWDHLGIGPEVDGDSIYNGAHDNASGTALMLGIAEKMSQMEKPERTVVFLAVTAEEQGLLGSKYYAQNPIFEPSKTVANINMDGVASYGAMKDLTIVGYGQSELDDIAGEIAKLQNRYLKADPEPGKGYFFRSDHFNFAKIGVPAIFASGTYEAVDGGVAKIQKLSSEYLNYKYHRPADEFDESWDFGGIQQDGDLFLTMGWKLANSNSWPKWKEGSEFKSIREASN